MTRHFDWQLRITRVLRVVELAVFGGATLAAAAYVLETDPELLGVFAGRADRPAKASSLPASNAAMTKRSVRP